MSSSKTKNKRMRTRRYTSNVFSMFNQAQIQEFKEAFNVIDQNRDGFIDKDDLIEMLTSLGKNPTDEYIDQMVNEAPGPLNFTMFLTLFGEKLNGTDPEDVIRNAFACFDPNTSGELSEELLREVMTTMGDRWTDEMVDELLTGAPIKMGVFDYVEFIRTLKHGAKEKDEEAQTQNPQQQLGEQQQQQQQLLQQQQRQEEQQPQQKRQPEEQKPRPPLSQKPQQRRIPKPTVIKR